MFSEDEEEEEEEETKDEYSCVDSTERANITCGTGTETLLFLHKEETQRTHCYSEEFISPRESLTEESEENNYSETSLSVHNSSQVSDLENEAVGEDFPSRDADSVPNSVQVYKSNKNKHHS